MPNELPSSPISEVAPGTNTRFSLRSLLVLTAIVAIVTAVCRHSLFATLAFGLPIVLYTIFSYALHRHHRSAWICLGISIFTSSFGIFVYSLYTAPTFNPYTSFDINLLPFMGLCSFFFGLILGFIPLLLEFWLRFIVDSLIVVVQVAKKFVSRKAQP